MMDNLDKPQSNCEELQAQLFADRTLIIVANRAPVHYRQNDQGELEAERGSGGLVTALTGLAKHVEPTWISCSASPADTVWNEGRVELDQEKNSIYVRFLTPDAEAYHGYYNVISNPLLWFLQHSMWDVPRAPIIDRNTWLAWENGYVAVNRQFADAVVRQVRTSAKRSLVMLQDYQLYLVAREVRRILKPRERPTLFHFVHIPWPGPEYWQILPPTMRQAILEGLCAVDILGFQTPDDGLNFLRTCESFLPKAFVKYKMGRVWYRNHSTYVRAFPVSIDVDATRKLAQSPAVLDYKKEIRDLVGDRQLILRVDRIEPSKNIVRGFQAYEELLTLYPEHRGKVKFLALLVPSRLGVGEYQDYLDELMAAAGRINAAFGDSDWEPVRLLVGENYPRAIAALELYDALLVNAISDGMNLVAKEGPVLNRRDGSLILSERAGARQQLESSALVISPCDVYATAQSLHRALTMSPEERRTRSERLRWLVERDDITAWLCWQLESILELDL